MNRISDIDLENHYSRDYYGEGTDIFIPVAGTKMENR